MPYPGWTPTRVRQFEHIRASLLRRGWSTEKATEIAARTVNKERALAGEIREPNRRRTPVSP